MKLMFLAAVLTLQYCSGEEGYFWHITDLHWDFSYVTYGLSCWDKNTSVRGLCGSYFCDSPWVLIEEVIKEAQKIKPDVDFILWSGDTSPHVKPKYMDTELVIKQIRNITELLKGYFPNVTVYPTLGNHDYYPPNQFPPSNNKIYNATYSLWNSWINDESQEQTFLKGGYYTVKTKFGLRIIAVNTALYYYDLETKTLDDPADQFAWLDDQLSLATSRGEKVIITGHVPPGFSPLDGYRQMYPHFNKKFILTVLRYSDVIIALHFGHEHHDNFRLFLTSSGSAVIPLFLAPSITPKTFNRTDLPKPYHNPAIRLIKYDRQTKRQLDILQYYVDLPTANRDKHVNLTLGYIATELYGIPDVMPDALALLVNKFQDPTGVYFKQLIRWYNTNGVQNYPCNDKCHKNFLCAIRYLDDDRYSKCMSNI